MSKLERTTYVSLGLALETVSEVTFVFLSFPEVTSVFPTFQLTRFKKNKPTRQPL